MREVMYSEKVTIYMSYEQRREIERSAVSRSAQSAREREQRNDKQPGR